MLGSGQNFFWRDMVCSYYFYLLQTYAFGSEIWITSTAVVAQLWGGGTMGSFLWGAIHNFLLQILQVSVIIIFFYLSVHNLRIFGTIDDFFAWRLTLSNTDRLANLNVMSAILNSSWMCRRIFSTEIDRLNTRVPSPTLTTTGVRGVCTVGMCRERNVFRRPGDSFVFAPRWRTKRKHRVHGTTIIIIIIITILCCQCRIFTRRGATHAHVCSATERGREGKK